MDVLTRLLDGVVDGPWLWLFIFAVVALDAVLPFIPSGTTITLAGVFAASDRLGLTALVVVASVAAFTSDNLVYAVGRRAGPRLLARAGRGRRSAGMYRWVRRAMQHRTAHLIILGRYLPGARVAVMLAAGALRCPPSRFWSLDAVAATLWAGTAALTGYFGGAAFGHQPLIAIASALGASAAIMGLIELGRRYFHALPARASGDERDRVAPAVVEGAGCGCCLR
ncbi:MAG TPA: VTT domain-containing protein [Planosporangium sp.]|nr:VTT domain-containing protein [Planosporangium sp.]